MNPTETLKHEHKIVLLVLKGAERIARTINEGGTADIGTVNRMVEFFREFTDRCHHSKEEKHLFPRLEERGVPNQGGPIGAMLHEHELGRARVRAIADAVEKVSAGDTSAPAVLAENLSAYVELLRTHIDKEDNVLFAMGDRVLTEDDKRELSEAFEKIEAEEMGEGTHEQYHEFAHEFIEG
jgi:hemerythrin-like domain-containing protein